MLFFLLIAYKNIFAIKFRNGANVYDKLRLYDTHET